MKVPTVSYSGPTRYEILHQIEIFNGAHHPVDHIKLDLTSLTPSDHAAVQSLQVFESNRPLKNTTMDADLDTVIEELKRIKQLTSTKEWECLEWEKISGDVKRVWDMVEENRRMFDPVREKERAVEMEVKEGAEAERLIEDLIKVQERGAKEAKNERVGHPRKDQLTETEVVDVIEVERVKWKSIEDLRKVQTAKETQAQKGRLAPWWKEIKQKGMGSKEQKDCSVTNAAKERREAEIRKAGEEKGKLEEAFRKFKEQKEAKKNRDADIWERVQKQQAAKDLEAKLKTMPAKVTKIEVFGTSSRPVSPAPMKVQDQPEASTHQRKSQKKGVHQITEPPRTENQKQPVDPTKEDKNNRLKVPTAPDRSASPSKQANQPQTTSPASPVSPNEKDDPRSPAHKMYKSRPRIVTQIKDERMEIAHVEALALASEVKKF